MNTKAEVRVMSLEAKEDQRLPAKPPGARQEAQSRFSQPQEGSNPAGALILSFQPLAL